MLIELIMENLSYDILELISMVRYWSSMTIYSHKNYRDRCAINSAREASMSSSFSFAHARSLIKRIWQFLTELLNVYQTRARGSQGDTVGVHRQSHAQATPTSVPPLSLPKTLLSWFPTFICSTVLRCLPSYRARPVFSFFFFFLFHSLTTIQVMPSPLLARLTSSEMCESKSGSIHTHIHIYVNLSFYVCVCVYAGTHYGMRDSVVMKVSEQIFPFALKPGGLHEMSFIVWIFLFPRMFYTFYNYSNKHIFVYDNILYIIIKDQHSNIRI